MKLGANKFILGQGVGYVAPDGLDAPLGLYVVIAKLPDRDGEFEYRIKQVNGPHEFTAKESELRWVSADTAPRNIGRDPEGVATGKR